MFITNGGIETTILYREHVPIRDFAAFDMHKDADRYDWIQNYLIKFVNIAKKYKVGCILESDTWRTNPDWIKKLGYSTQDMHNFNRRSIEVLCEIRRMCENELTPIVINGCIGPRSDGYKCSLMMTIEEAQEYHSEQMFIFSETNVDMVVGQTITYPEEAIGIVRAAHNFGLPVVISFTIETDGKLPNGQTLKEAIELVDKETQNTPLYYMINCVHPSYIESWLKSEEPWTERIRGVKGNASKKSHEELDESAELDDGDPVEFGEYNRRLLINFKNLNIFGGCCGTDERHVEEICKSCVAIFDQQKAKDTKTKE